MDSTAQVNGIDLHYIEQGQGQPVVFVHGGFGDYRVWAQQWDAFARTYRAIAVSCRGYWPNEKLDPDETITLDTFVDDLTEFVRTVGAGPVHLVGHSSPGGFGGLCLARNHPELLRSLVLLEPPAFPVLGVNIPPRPLQIIRLFLRSPRAGVALIKFGAKGARPAMRAFARGDDEEAVRAFVTANAGADVIAAMPKEQFDRFVANAGPLKAQLRAGFPRFGPDDAKAIRVPTLLVSGTRTPAHVTAVTDRLEKLIPDVQRLDIAGASHGMFTTHPAEFNAGVLRFIRAQGPPG
ncbi:alpha/beta hydrolase [Antribacter sp. KLBMP9083]|uniref:Alpha/beta hydrolase n=1 Tax=Antribacter soli TaxID=2910976 RepID=A0AA41QCR3_9MICO|nr:alpha/beta hydrolase [Antribacter soli]MCF4121053.1 alpha/beta hydrolase [Antribacter soli]